MGLIASLDMGAETMVMALGSVEEQSVNLELIKFQISQGIERGVIKDWELVKNGIDTLQTELLKGREIEVLNVSLSGAVWQVKEHRVWINLHKKYVEKGDLVRAEQRCREILKGEEIIDLIPVAYAVDRGNWIGNPLGKSGRELEVIYLVYQIDSNYLTQLHTLFKKFNNICFYPPVRAYQKVLPIVEGKELVLVDLGASGIQMALYKEGMLVHEAHLPLGCRTIDQDIMFAYGMNNLQAHKLKHEHGEALRSLCKNRKVQIPDTNLTLESRDLATIVQSRAEELLEGVAYMLQEWGCNDEESKILLTGGGCRLKNIDILLQRLSGISVEKVVLQNPSTSRGDVLKTPEYVVALGLLMCCPNELEEEESLVDRLMERLKKLW